MVYEKVISGELVDLKAAEIDDAQFTLSIRQDPEITKHLPRIDITLEQQRQWIKSQREKENGYFFVVWDKQGNRLGTIGIYDIVGNTGEGGRLALYGDPFQKIEAGLLMSEFEFEILHLEHIIGWVEADNAPAIRWNKWFGAALSEPEMDKRGIMIRRIDTTRDRARAAREKIRNIMQKGNCFVTL